MRGGVSTPGVPNGDCESDGSAFAGTEREVEMGRNVLEKFGLCVGVPDATDDEEGEFVEEVGIVEVSRFFASFPLKRYCSCRFINFCTFDEANAVVPSRPLLEN